MKNFFIWVMFLSITFTSRSQQEQKTITADSVSFENRLIGEELTYIVKYAFFNLGEVKLNVVEKTNIGNTTIYKTIAFIDSYPDLPFVSLHQVYESYIDSSLYPLKFLAKIFSDSVYVEYNFIGDTKIEIKKGKLDKSKFWFDSTVTINKKMLDGLSILYFTRMNFGKEQELKVPCFVNEKQETAILNYYNDSESVSIESIDYEVDCLYLDGYTDFVSIYGLTGNFEGWFSNDKYFVPIKAKLNVIIGNITLELIKWNEELWNPPLYKN